MITVKLDVGAFQRKAREMWVFGNDQLPFAISRTLNDTMFQDARPQLMGPTWQSAFTVRNPRLAGASMRVEKSTKGHLVAGVYDALGKANLETHATGGARPKSSRELAIPNQQRVRLHAHGRKPWARQLDRMVPKRALRVLRGQGIFVGEGGRLRAVYFLRQSARLDKRFAFYEDFARVSRAGIHRRFPGHLAAAVRSSFRS